MARARDSFAIALAALRGRLRDGHFAPGSSLIASDLAQALAVSITPVREALAHLAGERLIEERRGQGYFALQLEAGALEDLYRLHAVYVLAAVSARPRAAANTPRRALEDLDPLALREESEALFGAVVQATENLALIQAHRRATDQLAPARLHEGEVLDDLAGELKALANVLTRADTPAARAALVRYHDRRTAAAIRIASRLHSPSHYYPNII